MASIFERQKNLAQLSDRWRSPPDHLRPLLQLHRDDLDGVLTRAYRANKDWSALKDHCIRLITETTSKLASVDDKRGSIPRELCAWHWETWDALLSASNTAYARPEYV